MNATEALRHFEETEALLSGHFKLSSGLHSDKYLQCAKVLQWPDARRRARRRASERRSSLWNRRRRLPGDGRAHHRPRGGTRPLAPGDLHRTGRGGVRLPSRPRARAGRAGRRRRGRRDDGRLDARGPVARQEPRSRAGRLRRGRRPQGCGRRGRNGESRGTAVPVGPPDGGPDVGARPTVPIAASARRSSPPGRGASSRSSRRADATCEAPSPPFDVNLRRGGREECWRRRSRG